MSDLFPTGMSRYMWGAHSGDRRTACHVEEDGEVIIISLATGMIIQRWPSLDAARQSDSRIDSIIGDRELAQAVKRAAKVKRRGRSSR